MKSIASPSQAPFPTGPAPASDLAIPTLVAEVYESARTEERCHLVEVLLKPLGILSLVAIANGVFATIRFRDAGRELDVRADDLQHVHSADMVALVHHAQQVSVETVDSLVSLLTTSGGMASSSAAALLIGLLVQRAWSRRISERASVVDASFDPE